LRQELNERLKIEEALRKSEEELQSIFRASPIGIGVVIDQMIIAANDQLCAMTGYSREEILHQSIRILYPTDEDFEYVGKEKYGQIEEKDMGTVEARWKKKDGNVIDVLLSSTPIDPKHDIYHVTFTAMDVTERKQLARQLTESQKMESLGTLAGGIAHDFNNILNIILGYADRLLMNTEHQEKQKENIETIVKAAERAARLVKQILTFARRTAQERTPIHINTIVDEMAKMLYETFPRTIEISIEPEQYLSPILGDRNQIHQALLNLAVNARDAMPLGGKLIFKTELVKEEYVRSRFPNAAQGNYVCISVQDTGAGIDDATKQRIFEPFFTTKEYGKGTGLGLSVVYGIVAGMKGFIDMKSVLGQGTTFFLYLPAATDEYKPIQQEIIKVEIKGGHETLLVIEDEEPARKILTQTLEAKGYHVIEATDGEQALKVYRTRFKEIDLVLSDLGLPKMNGYECYKEMKKTHSRLLMILASGFIDPKEQVHMEENGIRLFVQKPYHMEQILISIREALDGEKR
jgi:PAS domain S-box-containing protein